MAESYKVEKEKNLYIIAPTDYLLTHYEIKEWPCCFTQSIVELYNFSVADFFKYVIAHFNGRILVYEEWPHFSIAFDKKFDADEFCKEINFRMGSFI